MPFQFHQTAPYHLSTWLQPSQAPNSSPSREVSKVQCYPPSTDCYGGLPSQNIPELLECFPRRLAQARQTSFITLSSLLPSLTFLIFFAYGVLLAVG